MNLTDNKKYLEQAMLQQAAMSGGQAPSTVPQAQDLSGISPQMQNIGQQQATQQQAMAQAEQNAAQAGQSQAPNFSPLAMAMALQKDKKKEAAAAEAAANRDASQWNQRPAIEFYSKGLDPMKIKSDEDY